MDPQVIDRRHDARFAPPARADATLRPGTPVVLVDVSAGGALIEAARPLRPGAWVHLLVNTDGHRVAIVAQVLRSMVWSLDPVDGVTYRGGLHFEHRVEWGWSHPARRDGPGAEHARPLGRRPGNQLPEKQATGQVSAGE